MRMRRVNKNDIHSSKQLKHENSKGPDVSSEVVTLVENDFGGDVLGSPAERPCLPTEADFLREAKITLINQSTCNTKFVFSSGHKAKFRFILLKLCKADCKI